jgi:hypothetical protein
MTSTTCLGKSTAATGRPTHCFDTPLAILEKQKATFFFFVTVPDGIFGGSICGRYRITAVAGSVGNDRQDAGPTKGKKPAGWNPALNAGLPHVTNPVYPTASQLEFLREGSGPLGVVPTGIVKLRAFDIARCSLMHVRRARSTFLHNGLFILLRKASERLFRSTKLCFGKNF